MAFGQFTWELDVVLREVKVVIEVIAFLGVSWIEEFFAGLFVKEVEGERVVDYVYADIWGGQRIDFAVVLEF